MRLPICEAIMKTSYALELTRVKGIGRKRRALLVQFKTKEQLKAASAENLRKPPAFRRQ
ncbi:MAG: hypothetical protein ACLS6W_04460 [Ruminococcus sp.]